MRICECPILVRRATLSPIAKGKVPADGKITQICRGWPKQAPPFVKPRKENWTQISRITLIFTDFFDADSFDGSTWLTAGYAHFDRLSAGRTGNADLSSVAAAKED
jgi:hypothetical protein